MRISRDHSFILLIIVLSVMLSIGKTASASESPDLLEIRTFVLEGHKVREPLADPMPPIRVVAREFRAAQPTQEPSPSPLPTPVTPTDVATGWIIPPPAPVLIAPTPTRIANLLIMPISGTITTFFSSWHPAVDIANNCGTPVKAGADGVVTWVGWKNNGGGNVVEINHSWGSTDYDHLSGFAVAPGQRVAQGEVVAYVGSSGNSTGCHLHWALRVDGRWQNPLQYLL